LGASSRHTGSSLCRYRRRSRRRRSSSSWQHPRGRRGRCRRARLMRATARLPASSCCRSCRHCCCRGGEEEDDGSSTHRPAAISVRQVFHPPVQRPPGRLCGHAVHGGAGSLGWRQQHAGQHRRHRPPASTAAEPSPQRHGRRGRGPAAGAQWSAAARLGAAPRASGSATPAPDARTAGI
jgi:hypothetical protein